MGRITAATATATPLLGPVVLATLVLAHRPAFDAIVREDSVLEWAEVCVYGAAAVALMAGYTLRSQEAGVRGPAAEPA